MNERMIDVRDLAPPAPLERILDELTRLGPNEQLHVLHWREPFPLYPLLEDLGFRWRTETGDAVPFEIFIWHGEAP